MDNMENRADLTADEAAFVHLIERALIEGSIREDRLRASLQRLNAGPDVFRSLCRQLLEENIRLIPPEAEPQYPPQIRDRIRQLLDDGDSPLTMRERLVLTLRLRENKTTEEVAARMGVSRERILLVERKAIRLLRAKKIRDFCQ